MVNDKVVVALAKGIDKDIVAEASDGLSVGKHPVNALVKVVGTLTKGEDYTQTIWQKLQPMKILAVALSKQNDVTCDYIMELAKEALALADDSELLAQTKKNVTKAIEDLKIDKGQEVCSGKVTTELVFSLVGIQQEKEEVLTTEKVKEKKSKTKAKTE